MKRTFLLAEFLVVFVAVPFAYRLDWIPLPLFPALWLLAAACFVWLLRAPDFETRSLWSAAGLRAWVRPIVVSLVAGVPLLGLATWAIAPDRMFGFVRERPGMWALVMVLYPILSVLPQGIVYRAFVFHRYRALFPSPTARIVASAIAFSLVHVIFENRIAPAFSLVGGVLFAWTYERSGSTVVAAVQHALFGCAIFTLGLGWYFYAGAVR